MLELHLMLKRLHGGRYRVKFVALVRTSARYLATSKARIRAKHEHSRLTTIVHVMLNAFDT